MHMELPLQCWCCFTHVPLEPCRLSHTYEEETHATWLVVGKTSSGNGLVTTSDIDPFYDFHSINAYEVQGADNKMDIIADNSAYENMDISRAHCWEPIFIANPGATDEDSRVSLSVELDG